MTLSRSWVRPVGKSKKAVFDANPSFFEGVTLSQKPKSSNSAGETSAFLMSLMQKIHGLRKNIMSCYSEIHSLRKSHNVTPPEICCPVRKLKKSNGTGRGISLLCEKKETQPSPSTRSPEISMDYEKSSCSASAMARDFAEVLHRVQRPQHQKVRRIVNIEEVFMKLPVGLRLLPVIEARDAYEAQHHAERLRQALEHPLRKAGHQKKVCDTLQHTKTLFRRVHVKLLHF